MFPEFGRRLGYDRNQLPAGLQDTFPTFGYMGIPVRGLNLDLVKKMQVHDRGAWGHKLLGFLQYAISNWPVWILLKPSR